jgi:hypothetical protein
MIYGLISMPEETVPPLDDLADGVIDLIKQLSKRGRETSLVISMVQNDYQTRDSTRLRAHVAKLRKMISESLRNTDHDDSLTAAEASLAAAVSPEIRPQVIPRSIPVAQTPTRHHGMIQHSMLLRFPPCDFKPVGSLAGTDTGARCSRWSPWVRSPNSVFPYCIVPS